MFKNFGLGTKIILGFLAVVALVAVAGVSGYWGVERVGNALHVVANEEAPVVDASMEMMLAVSAGKMLGDELKGATSVMASDDASQIEGISNAFDAATEDFDTFAGLILKGGDFEGGTWIETDNEELATAIRQTEKLHDDRFQPAFKSLVETGQKLLTAKAAASKAMETAEQEYEDLVIITGTFEKAVSAEISKSMAAADTVEAARSVVIEEVPLADCAMEIKFAIAQSRMVMEEIAQARTEAEITAVIPEYDQSISDFDELIGAVLKGGNIEGLKIVATDNDDVRKAVETLNTDHGHFEKAATEMIAKQRDMITMVAESDQIMTELDVVGEEMDALLAKVEELAGAEMDKATKDGETAKATVTWSLITIVIGSVVTGLCIGIFLTRSITKVLNRIVSSLAEGSEQVTSAAGQVSASSQSLAEGATEQAAGLEETSSSLEEMSSMTKQNADNAQQANTLASEARKAADNGAESMNRMNTAIHDIQKSSDETAKIIKVIDEIAFQTNLLALNAAVEAARAGEAGKGFAVVAEEVRNLAMRSAEAAKNTSSLIEESVKNSKNGVDIATEVGKVLEEIISGIGKTSDLVGEIAAASQEQAQGIEQVNTAVNQMDKVTQQNAANAEESASASEELSAQAEQMNGVVNELRSLVGGAGNAGLVNPARTTSSRPAMGASDHAFHQIAGKASAATHKAKAKVSPDRVIPLGDSDSFDDFNS